MKILQFDIFKLGIVTGVYYYANVFLYDRSGVNLTLLQSADVPPPPGIRMDQDWRFKAGATLADVTTPPPPTNQGWNQGRSNIR